MENKPAAKRLPIVGIYWRKLGFFVAVFLVVFAVWEIVASNRYSADQTVSDASNFQTNAEVGLSIQTDGSVLENGKKVQAKINPQKNFDELRMVIYDQNGYYLNNLTVHLTLPAAVANESNPQILAIHGVDSSSYTIEADNQIDYTAAGVGPGATVTVVAQLPKGVIKLPLYQEIIYLLSTFGSSIWLVLAVAAPLVALIYMIFIISLQLKSQRVPAPGRSIVAPPMALPPAVVGVLASQEIGPREISATLIDLALRKFIFIIDRDRGFSFGKRNFFGQLLPFEKILLSKIFRQDLKISESEIQSRFANHLYSRKMSLFTQEIYSLATRLGYFKENPSRMHRRYQFIGTILFFFALVFFFLTLKYFSSLEYAAFFWIGMMLAGLVVIIVGSQMPIRAALGRQALSNWLAFKQYLSDPRPLPYEAKNYQKFVDYLPYAIIFHCEALWVRRFSEEGFTLPDWFLTDKSGLGLQDFCLALFPIIGYVGQNLAVIREPGYK